MKKLLPPLLALIASGSGIALAQSAPSPAPSSPRPWPWNVVPFPKCIEPAARANAAIKVFEVREDWDRVISASVAAAKRQAECARQFTGNRSGQYNLRMLAASNYARAADLAFKLKEYSLVPKLVASSNGLFYVLLKYRKPIFESDLDQSISANITANNDLLKRIPRRRTP